jgi:competence protein ComFC
MFMWKKFCDIFYRAIDYLFPKACIECKKEGDFLCDECFLKIRKYPTAVFKNIEPGLFEKIIIPCPFHKNPILRKSLHALKYKFYKDISEKLAKLFCDLEKEIGSSGKVIVPMPLHKKRLKFRGFNQSEELAKHLGIPVCNLLIRMKHTKAQAKLSKKERLENTKDAFLINPLIHVPKSTTIILIDDVCTTFSTMKSAAFTLQKKGFSKIIACAVAYAELDQKT